MYVSIRDGCLPAAGFSSLSSGMRELGLTAFELSIDREMNVYPIDGGWENGPQLNCSGCVAKYMEALDKHGLRVSSLLLATDFSRDDLEDEIAWVQRCAEHTHQFGGDAVRVDAIMRAPDWTDDRRRSVFIESMRTIIAATEESGMKFGIENHGPKGNEPGFIEPIIAGVDSPRFGVTLDTANFYWSGKPIDEVHAIIERLAPRAVHTHMKNIQYPPDQSNVQRETGWRYRDFSCAIPDGDIDIARTVSLLRDAGYDSDLCIENEALGRYSEAERQAMLKREVDYLKGLV